MDGSACSARVGPRRPAPRAGEIGADQFALYLMHDDEEKTLTAYGEEVIPALS